MLATHRCSELGIDAVKLYLDAKKSLTFLFIRGKMPPLLTHLSLKGD